ncbi:hypothetical protein HNQ59_003388 [Chitinivorax tropicus]|uniref:DUF4124 domain-containing protein n=1 Tax=Chitinivorax tropicus TaxID=714531 RepID=A0A840MRM7_9PROT|nr:DUF4124 domain-containing protein [Chitinivorax tropicus]MBB5020075.1 hypothetical protein [Chitinivorax tropicus]
MLRWLLILAVLAGGAYWLNVGQIRERIAPQVAHLTGAPPASAPHKTAEVVRWRDKNGTWTYGDAAAAPKGAKVERVSLRPLTTVPAHQIGEQAAQPAPTQPPRSALDRNRQEAP